MMKFRLHVTYIRQIQGLLSSVQMVRTMYKSVDKFRNVVKVFANIEWF